MYPNVGASLFLSGKKGLGCLNRAWVTAWGPGLEGGSQVELCLPWVTYGLQDGKCVSVHARSCACMPASDCKDDMMGRRPRQGVRTQASAHLRGSVQSTFACASSDAEARPSAVPFLVLDVLTLSLTVESPS